MKLHLLALLPVAALGCDRGARVEDSRAARSTPILAASTGVIDSATSSGDALGRFRADLKDRPATLANAARSRGALVRRFVRALETRDTIALRDLVLSRAEFAYLYYPTSTFSRPPYELPPGTLWLLMQASSLEGLRRALDRFGGQPLNYVDYRCQSEPERQGENAVWTGCSIRRIAAPGDTVAEALFGSIIEREGRFKFVTYSNQL